MCGGGGGSNDALYYQQRQDRERKQRIAEGEAQLEQLFAPLEGNRYVANAPFAGLATEDEFLAAVQEALAPQAARDQQVASQQGFFGSALRDVIPSGTRRGDTVSPLISDDAYQNMINLGFNAEDLTSKKAEDYLQFYRGHDYRTLEEGVTDPIWEQHKQAYLDYANPQLDRQFSDARDQLTYALARSGQTGGSVAVDRREELETDLGERQLEIAQAAQGYGNQAKSDLANQKSTLYSMLSNTANPGATTQAARSALASISAQPSMNPLGLMFQNATAGLAGAVPAYRQGEQVGQVNNIIYGRDPESGSGRVVR